MQVQVPKLSPDGANWVIYCDRLKWAMQTNSFNAHVSDTSPTQVYTTLGMIGGLTPDVRWEKKENCYDLLFLFSFLMTQQTHVTVYYYFLTRSCDSLVQIRTDDSLLYI
jgi:hypothetical protein